MTKTAVEKAGISMQCFLDWVSDDQEFSVAVARAKKQWAQVTAEKGFEICKAEPRKIISEDGSERVDPGWVQHITSQLNYTKWLISKRDPETFGDAGKATNINVGVGVQVGQISEEKRAEVMRKKQAAIARRSRKDLTVKAPINGTNGNGHH